jgi:Mrp family chromosome partitioning ATPase
MIDQLDSIPHSPVNGRPPSLHLFSENPQDGRSYADIEFIQHYQQADREYLAGAMEAISPAEMFPTTKSNAAAGIGYLANRLLDLSATAGGNLFLFNSPADEDLALELIYQLAEGFGAEKKILIVDCNLRTPTGPKPGGELNYKGGLSDYVSGTVGLDDIVLRTELQNVFWLGGGDPLDFPVRVLMSNRFLQLMELLKKRFDLVLLNSPPYRECIDTFVLAKFLRPIMVLALKGEKLQDIQDIRKELAVLDLKSLTIIAKIANCTTSRFFLSITTPFK